MRRPRALLWSLHSIWSNTNQRGGDKREQVSRDNTLFCQILRRRRSSTCGGVGEAVETRDSRNSRRDNILFPSSRDQIADTQSHFSTLAGRGLGHDIVSPQPQKEARRTRHVSRPLILFLRNGNMAFR